MPSVATSPTSIKPSRQRRVKAPLATVTSIEAYIATVNQLNTAEACLGEAAALVVRERRAGVFNSAWQHAQRVQETLTALAASTPGLRRACERELARAGAVLAQSATGYGDATAEVHGADVIDLAAARARRAVAR